MNRSGIIFVFFTCFCPLNISLHSVNEKHHEELSKEITDWDARLEYARLLGYQHKYDESLNEYHKLLAIKPHSHTIHIEMAKTLYYQHKYKDALAILDEIPQKNLDEETRLLIADLNIGLKKYPQAESIFREHLKSHDDDIIKFKLAELLSWEKKYIESLPLFTELLTKRPNDIQLRRKYAMVLMWKGDFKEASEQLKKTLPDGES